MNVLVLMAGDSKAYEDAGYLYPKNLVEVDGIPLAQLVLESIRNLCPDARFIVAVRAQEDRQFHIGSVIRLLLPDSAVVVVPDTTAGAACTALMAIQYINNSEPLLIVNGDQIITEGISEALGSFQNRDLDGGILAFKAVHPRWSYVKCDAEGMAVEAAEKRPISDLATAGFYYFARGTDFVTAASNMIMKDAHVGGKFYVCPVYNELLLLGAQIGVYQIKRASYFSLAQPQELHVYESYLKTQYAER